MGFGHSLQAEIKEALLQESVVTVNVLQEALGMSENKHTTLLSAVLELQKFDSKKLLRLLNKRFGYPLVSLSAFSVDQELLRHVPVKLAQKYTVLPISCFDKTLTVAMADPTWLEAIDDLSAVSGMRIKVAVTDAASIKQYIAIYYQEAKPSENPSEQISAGESLDDIVKMIEVDKAEGNGQESEKDLLKEAYETPVIKLVNLLLVEGIRRKASDIFIEPWENFVRVRARVDGLLEEVLRPQKSLGTSIVSRIKVMSELDISEHRIPQDGRFKIKVKEREVDMRVSILPSSFGEKVCLRILDTKSQSHDIAKLGFTDNEQQIIKDSAEKPHGMILVTGPTGSGKTTTLYSVLEYLDNPDVNITTVEDPVEYQIPGINQVNVKEAIGLTFPAALRSILRQDPDVILIGEIRDKETLDIAVKAALTGHLVLSTLHTNDAASSITRMMNMGLEPFLIASTVIMISAQRLVRRLCERCRIQEEIKPETLNELGLTHLKDPVFYRAKGCPICRQTGYRGRTVITEILPVLPEIREAMMKGTPAEQLKGLAQRQGMSTLRESALKKALSGETSLDEVFRVTSEDQSPDQEDQTPFTKGRS